MNCLFFIYKKLSTARSRLGRQLASIGGMVISMSTLRLSTCNSLEGLVTTTSCGSLSRLILCRHITGMEIYRISYHFLSSNLTRPRKQCKSLIDVLILKIIWRMKMSFFGRRKKTEKEKEQNNWRRKINGNNDQPTNQLTDRANTEQYAYSKVVK